MVMAFKLCSIHFRGKFFKWGGKAVYSDLIVDEGARQEEDIGG
jgi:predicted membrane GTPase involved in stress response